MSLEWILLWKCITTWRSRMFAISPWKWKSLEWKLLWICICELGALAWNEMCCEYASANGHLEVLKYLHENGCSWKEKSWKCCEFASFYGHLEVLKYLHQNGCPLNDLSTWKWMSLECRMLRMGIKELFRSIEISSWKWMSLEWNLLWICIF